MNFTISAPSTEFSCKTCGCLPSTPKHLCMCRCHTNAIAYAPIPERLIMRRPMISALAVAETVGHAIEKVDAATDDADHLRSGAAHAALVELGNLFVNLHKLYHSDGCACDCSCPFSLALARINRSEEIE